MGIVDLLGRIFLVWKSIDLFEFYFSSFVAVRDLSRIDFSENCAIFHWSLRRFRVIHLLTCGSGEIPTTT
jgi:hypothetical protein